ncbi:MAG: TolC family protein, partial [Phycisphaerae bacterium]
TLAQNLVDLWQIPIRKRAAQRGLDRTILEVGALAARVAAEAKAAYHAAIGADRRLDIARENLELTGKVLELTELRRDAGAGSALDVNLARGVVLETELAVQQLRLEASTARRRLAGTLGLTVDADTLTLTESLPDPPAHELLTESLVQTALELRLDVRAVRTAVLAAEDRLVLEYRRVFPSVSIGLALERAERGRSSSRDVLADTARSSIAGGRLTAPEIQPRSARRKNTDLIIGPSLSLALPIFDQNQAQIARARFELQQGRRVLQGLERAIRQDVRGAVDRARTAWQIARFYRNQVVPQAQKSLDMSRQSYHAGRASILSVLDAERSFLSARDRYAQALQVAAASVPALERAIGLPMERLLSLDDAEQPLPAAIQPSSDAATPPDETVDEEPESNDGAEL